MTDDFKMMIRASLFSALIAASAFIPIPIGPVPITLQTLFVFLAGLILGGKWAAASVGVYLIAGIAGLPVFSGGAGGLGRFVGPTGGYLVGFFIAAYLVGIISSIKKTILLRIRKNNKSVYLIIGIISSIKQNALFDVLAMLIGCLVIYFFGVLWLKIVLGFSFQKTIAIGVYPFLIGDAIKIAAAVPIAKSLRSIL